MSGAVFVCGTQRSGTTALYNALRLNPEFFNDRYFAKEFRFYERLIGNRPWGKIDTFPALRLEQCRAMDDEYVERGVVMIDEIMRKYAAGPNGRYLVGNPQDVFYVDYILRAVPDAKFLILVRHPLEFLWSLLNLQSKETAFQKESIDEAARRWKTAVWSAHAAAAAHQKSYLVVEHGALTQQPKEILLDIARFVGVEPHSESVDFLTSTLIHSSFHPDHRIAHNQTEKTAHFDTAREQASRHAELVLAANDCLLSAREPLKTLRIDYAAAIVTPVAALLSRRA